MGIDSSNQLAPWRFPRRVMLPDRDYEFGRLSNSPSTDTPLLDTNEPYRSDYRSPVPSEPSAPRTIGPVSNVHPVYYIARSLCIWSVVCSISAIPSWLTAIGMINVNQQLAMALGIATFVVLYTALDFATRNSDFRRIAEVRTAMRITYIIRLTLSVTMIGSFIDIPCGVLSGTIISVLGMKLAHGHRVDIGTLEGQNGESVSLFAEIYAWTLVQGLVLNLVLFLLCCVILSFIHLMNRLASRDD